MLIALIPRPILNHGSYKSSGYDWKIQNLSENGLSFFGKKLLKVNFKKQIFNIISEIRNIY